MTSRLQEIIAEQPVEWMPALMLLFLLMWHPWSFYAPTGSLADLSGKVTSLLAVVGLLLPPVGSSPWLWLAIAIAHGSWIVSAYRLADNHQYLIGYWCLAICIALTLGNESGSAVLARNGELLIGACFSCALGAKLASRRYRDGSFFAHMLVRDDRFLLLATVLAGVTPHERTLHRTAPQRVRAGDGSTISVPMSGQLEATALFLTWWTVAIESVVSLSFLLPFEGDQAVRAGLLGLFVLTTYLLISVPAFGQILLIMAMATVDEPWLRGTLLIAALSLRLLSFLPEVVVRLGVNRHNRTLSNASSSPELLANRRPPAGTGVFAHLWRDVATRRSR